MKLIEETRRYKRILILKIEQHLYPDSCDRWTIRSLSCDSKIPKYYTYNTTMKLLLSILLVLTATLLSVEGKLPDYINVCKRNDPQISKCIENSVISLLDRLAVGIPELEVPALDPLYLERLVLNLGPGVKAEARHLKLTGAKSLQIKDLDADLNRDTLKLTVTLPEINIRGKYELDGKLGSLPLRGNGPINILAKSVTGRGTLQGKKVFKGGKTLYYFPSMDLKLQIGDYNMRLENLFEGDPTVGEATNKILNEEKTEVLNSLLPGIEKAVIEQILVAANNICKHFTWDELFPES